MLTLIYSKLKHNLVLSLFLISSAVLFTALITSIPLFTNGILQRMLTKDLERSQEATQVFPGNISITQKYFEIKENPLDHFRELDDYINEHFIPGLETDLRTAVTIHSLKGCNIHRLESLESNVQNRDPYLIIQGISGLENEIELISGRMPADSLQGRTIEVIVSKDCFIANQLFLDQRYAYASDYSGLDHPFDELIIVGIFEPKLGEYNIWNTSDYNLLTTAMIPMTLMEDYFVNNHFEQLSQTEWRLGMDYHQLKSTRIDSLLRHYNRSMRTVAPLKGESFFAAQEILKNYSGRARYLTVILWFLYIPILILLAFLIYMISQMLLDSEKSSLAVMKNRGASRSQILKLALVESSLIAGFAVIVGPWLGYLFCSVIGASSGFLEFIQRDSLKLQMNLETQIYAIIGSIFFIITMMLPTLKVTNVSIVALKRSKINKGRSKPFWKKYFLDLILMAISLYGLFSYRQQARMIAETGAQGSDMPLDPLLFGVSTLFILACGLIALRIIPLLIKLLFSIGKKKWNAVFYGSLIQVMRGGGKEEFLILFLIFCLALGIFDSTAARTMNRNMEERIRYRNGTDLALELFWNVKRTNDSVAQQMQMMRMDYDSEAGITSAYNFELKEPPFEPYTELPGVQIATRVAKDTVTTVLPGERVKNIDFMGIIPSEFGRTGWMRHDLFPVHWYHYLNAIAETPQGILVSRNLKDDYDLKLGDMLTLKFDEQSQLPFFIYGFFEYWPSYIPYEDDGDPRYMMVGNLKYVNGFKGVIPYEVWITRDEDASTSMLYSSIEEENLPVIGLTDTRQELRNVRNDPLFQGVNGVFSLGFLICLAICFTGFTLYWLFSLKDRMMQLGIFRAMGLSSRETTAMLLIEQIILVGGALLFGIGAGILTSKLFVPMLQIAESAAAQIPPFLVYVENSDILRIVSVCLLMFAIGAVFFRRLIKGLQISRSLKLGED